MTTPSRQISYLPISDLQPDPRNPKSHALDVIDDSIGRFGYVEPIVIDERTGFIVSGHGRTKTLQQMAQRGETPPEGLQIDADGNWLAPVVTGWASRSDSEAAAALIALNRTTELGGWVDDALLNILEELTEVDAEHGLDGLGFDYGILEELRNSVDEGVTGGSTGFAGEDDEDEDDERDLEPSGQSFKDLDVLVGEPKHDTPHGSVYRLGERHLMVVAKLGNEHHLWSGYLEGRSFAPYPDVYLLLGIRAKTEDFLLVQPNKYLAGHVLDKWASVHGEESIERIEQ